MARPVLRLTARLRAGGFAYSARRHQITRTGQRDIHLPYTYLGANDRAGPGYTGQPAVYSHYSEITESLTGRFRSHAADRVERHGHGARPRPCPRSQSAAVNSASRGPKPTGSLSRRATRIFARPRKEPPFGAAGRSMPCPILAVQIWAFCAL
jgi:hypothetical protein